MSEISFDDLVPENQKGESLSFDDLIPRGAASGITDGAPAKASTNPQPAEDNRKKAMDYGLNLFREGLQGATLYSSDEMGAALAAGLATLTHDTDFKTAYKDIVGSIQSEQNQFRDQNPIASTVAQLGGGIATGGATFGKLAQATQTMKFAPRLRAGAGLGGAEGFLAGYASGDTSEERKTGAISGAIIGAPLGIVGGEVGRALASRSTARQAAEKLLKSGSDDKGTAKYMLNAKGKAVTNKAAIEAVKQGYDEGVVAMINGASRSDRSNMRKMLYLQERAINNAKEGVTNRPSKVIGNSIELRLRHVRNVNKRSGIELDRVATSLKGKPANFTQEVDQFVGSLADQLEVTLRRDSSGVIKPDFSGSIIRNNPAGKRLIKNIVDEMQIGKDIDAYQAHRLKTIIDDQVEFGKRVTGLSGKTERVVKDFRYNLNQSLRKQFPEYKKVNEAFSETISVLNKLQDAAGKKIDPFGRNGDEALGTLSNTLLGNAKIRVNLSNTIEDLARVSNKYGGKFDDNIAVQAKFFSELDHKFGPIADRSLAGETAKGVKKGVRAALGSKTEALVDAVGAGVDRAQGINNENAIKAMRKLLQDAPEPAGKQLITK